MIAMDIPDDLKRAPFEIARDFVIEFNKALVSGIVDPTKTARDFLIQKYSEKGEPQGKIFLQSEMKGCMDEQDIVEKGGPGSGNFGHGGRPGKVGGSGSGVGVSGPGDSSYTARDVFPSGYSEDKIKESTIKSGIAILKERGVKVEFYHPNVLGHSIKIDPKSLSRIEPEASRAIASITYLQQMPSSIFSVVKTVKLYSNNCDLGIIESGGKKFHRGGDFSIASGTIRAKLNVKNTLQHEVGHAAFSTLQIAADKGVSEKAKAVKNEWSKTFEPSTGLLIKSEGTNQEAYNFFVKNIKNSLRQVGFASEYVKSWDKEIKIIDEGKEHMFIQPGGGVSRFAVTSVQRVVNENFAEMWRNTTGGMGGITAHTELIKGSLSLLRKM